MFEKFRTKAQRTPTDEEARQLLKGARDPHGIVVAGDCDTLRAMWEAGWVEKVSTISITGVITDAGRAAIASRTL